MKNNKVLFFRVKDNQTKLRLICSKAQESIIQEKKLLIVVPNEEAATYINNLLWKEPADSFVPHCISNSPTNEWVVISHQGTVNVNQASWLLNLCNQICPIFQEFEEIYELLDESSAEKKNAAATRQEAYKNRGVAVKCV